MTSSLVGSEMCIRDRRSWRQFMWRNGHGPARLLQAGRTWLMMMRALAVSYTHLTLPTICSV
eukprot:1316849-Prorocentrum_lima.AAC.1